jgi:hypothetical protein
MSQFAQSGSAMDDAQASDGDGGFVGINQRLQLNQLEVGEVRESLNGRMDGHWKPRRGVVARTGSLASGGRPLQLPFFLIDVAKTISNATVSGGVVTLTVTGHGLPIGEAAVANVSGLSGNAAMNGNFTLTVTGANTLTYSVPTLTSISDSSGFLGGGVIIDGANADVRASCLFSDPNSGNAESVVLALGSKAILVDLDGYGTQDISYPIGKALAEDADLIQAFDRVYLFRDGEQGFEWFPNGRQIEAASQNGGNVVVTLRNHGLSVGDSVDISGLTGGTPVNGTFLVASVPTKDTFTYSTTTDRIAVTGALVPDATGIYFPSTPNPFPVWAKTPGLGGEEIYYDSGDSRWNLLKPTSPGFVTWRSNVTTDLNPLNATGWVPHLNVIAPPATGTPVLSPFTQIQTFGVTDAVLKSGFTLVPAGVYTQPQVFVTVGADGSVTDGLVSLDVTGNTTIVAGDTIVIYETDVPEFSAISGKSFEVSSATTTNISFFAPVADLASLGGGLEVEFGGRFSVGGGFIHQPAPPWGVYFQRRLWVPFYYTPAGTFNAPTYTDREITDEISVSDILDSNTFDQIANQFRITGGTTDYLVAMKGFYDDKLVALNRNSLHLISGTAGSLADTKVTQLTTEVGCLARKSVIMKGNAMFFLSDDGVYAVEFLNDYNLRGADEPISKNIQPYIDRINKDLAAEAVGVLFNNRYYLAVALDSIAGANDAIGNNSILIFNFLNKAWESIDTFGAGDFIIKNLIIGSAAERDSIYAVTSLGGLHELEAAETSNDNLISSGLESNFLINSSLTTRGYALGNLDRKRFTDGQVTMQCVGGGLGEYEISFAAEDPDDNQPIGTTTTFLGGTVLGTGSSPEDETGNIRFRLGGVRGYVGSLTLTRTIGSPKVTSIKVTGSVTNRQIISQT